MTLGSPIEKKKIVIKKLLLNYEKNSASVKIVIFLLPKKQHEHILKHQVKDKKQYP